MVVVFPPLLLKGVVVKAVIVLVVRLSMGTISTMSSDRVNALMMRGSLGGEVGSSCGGEGGEEGGWEEIGEVAGGGGNGASLRWTAAAVVEDMAGLEVRKREETGELKSDRVGGMGLVLVLPLEAVLPSPSFGTGLLEAGVLVPLLLPRPWNRLPSFMMMVNHHILLRERKESFTYRKKERGRRKERRKE